MSKQPINIHIQHLVREIKVECVPGTKINQEQLQIIENQVIGTFIRVLESSLDTVPASASRRSYNWPKQNVEHPPVHEITRMIVAKELENCVKLFNLSMKMAEKLGLEFEIIDNINTSCNASPENYIEVNIKYDNQK